MAKKGKKNQQNYWDEDFEDDAPQGETLGEESATPTSTEGTPVPEEAGAEAVEADFMSTLKKSEGSTTSSEGKEQGIE